MFKLILGSKEFYKIQAKTGFWVTMNKSGKLACYQTYKKAKEMALKFGLDFHPTTNMFMIPHAAETRYRLISKNTKHTTQWMKIKQFRIFVSDLLKDFCHAYL